MSDHALTSSGTTRLLALRRGLSRDSAAGALLAIMIGFLVAHMPAAPAGPLLLLAVAAPVVALVVGDLRRVLLAVVLLDIPLHWDVNLGWRPEAAAVGAVGGIGISGRTLRALRPLCALDRGEDSVGRAHPASALAGAPAGRVRRRDGPFARRRRGSSTRCLPTPSAPATLLLFLYYVANQVRNQEDVVFIVVGLLAGFLFESAVMIALSALGISFQWMGLASHSQELVGTTAEDARAGGTIGRGNGAAAYIAMLLPISIVVLWMTSRLDQALLAGRDRGRNRRSRPHVFPRRWLAAIVAALFVAIIAVRRGDDQVAGLRPRVRWFSFFSSHSTATSKLEFPARPTAPRTRKMPASANQGRVEDHSGSTHSGRRREQFLTGSQPIRRARVQSCVAAHRP